MDKLSQFPESSLTREKWQELEQTVFESVKKQLVGRRFIDIYGPLGEGVQSITNDIYETPNQEPLVFMVKTWGYLFRLGELPLRFLCYIRISFYIGGIFSKPKH